MSIIYCDESTGEVEIRMEFFTISNEGSIDGSVDLLSISILKERKRFFERKGGHFSNED